MDASRNEQRNVSGSHFGDHTLSNQGNIQGNLTVNYGSTLPHQPARPEIVHVIPYPRNEDLVQRTDLVDKLNEVLSTPCAGSAALWGLGGSGKTQIALDFAYRRCSAEEKCCVFWVHAENEATFTSDYEAIGKQLGVDPTFQGSELLEEVRREIESKSRWLLVIDNADDLRLFGVGLSTTGGGLEKRSLFKFVPRALQGNVLWTSRDERITGTLVGAPRCIPVQSMAMDEAVTLLATVRGIPPTSREPAVDSLVSELQYLPLAISQAGGYMRRISMSPEKYLDLLKQGTTRWELLGISDADRHRRPEVSNSVLETWKISTDRIWAESKMSYRLLHIIAYVDNQDIPEELLTAAANLASAVEIEASAQPTELETLAAIARLRELCFISHRKSENTEPSYEMHKLVQEALRYRLSIENAEEIAIEHSSSARADSDKLKMGEGYYSRLALQLIRALFPGPQPDSWARCEQFMTHAIRVGEWADISKADIGTVSLLSDVCIFLDQRGRWREVEPVAHRALSLSQKALGATHSHSTAIKRYLVQMYSKQGLNEEAERLQLEILEVQREALGEKHADTIASMSDLAKIYSKQRRNTEAQEILREVLEIQQDMFGPKDKRTINSMSRLAHTYLYQQRYEEAQSLYFEVLELRREVIGGKHRNTMATLDNIALTFRVQKQWDKCEDFLQQSQDLSQEVLGDLHPDTIRVLYNFGETYYLQGRYAEAESYAQIALDRYMQVLEGAAEPTTSRRAS
ncbi:hypothetical protein F53441_5360 [Fusarium austroafricanum]|uniref:AAA+ ATPase domain-containing protein n=1 Tax=Fusarium austroafricanum TaxID=2364996 RepID=A0A8H4P0Q2_9HYPO|nr:hypothetical protein F53441_5360 [Fusarium austroafricanum]